MAKTRNFVLPALLALVASAFAQQGGAPVLFGRADFEMEWKVEPPRLVLSARYLAARGMMRLEVLDGSSRVVLRNLATGEATLMIRQGQGGAYSYKMPPMGAFRPSEAGEISEIGGEKCRAFTVPPVSLCLTEDGIPLKMQFPQGSLTASRLIRQPQPPALFELAKDIKPRPLPSGVQPPPLPF